MATKKLSEITTTHGFYTYEGVAIVDGAGDGGITKRVRIVHNNGACRPSIVVLGPATDLYDLKDGAVTSAFLDDKPATPAPYAGKIILKCRDRQVVMDGCKLLNDLPGTPPIIDLAGKKLVEAMGCGSTLHEGRVDLVICGKSYGGVSNGAKVRMGTLYPIVELYSMPYGLADSVPAKPPEPAPYTGRIALKFKDRNVFLENCKIQQGTIPYVDRTHETFADSVLGLSGKINTVQFGDGPDPDRHGSVGCSIRHGPDGYTVVLPAWLREHGSLAHMKQNQPQSKETPAMAVKTMPEKDPVARLLDDTLNPPPNPLAALEALAEKSESARRDDERSRLAKLLATVPSDVLGELHNYMTVKGPRKAIIDLPSYHRIVAFYDRDGDPVFAVHRWHWWFPVARISNGDYYLRFHDALLAAKPKPGGMLRKSAAFLFRTAVLAMAGVGVTGLCAIAYHAHKLGLLHLPFVK